MPYTDWATIVDTTIVNKKEIKMLEFGLGDGTQYLVDNFEFVYSHELIDDSQPNLINYYNTALNKYSSYTNWASELVMWKDIGFKDYDPNLPIQLLNRIDELFLMYKFEAVLVDGGYHVRGDIANYILNKWSPDYVIIHDTNFAYEVDGYTRIQLPSSYTTIEYLSGEGTHIFKKR